MIYYLIGLVIGLFISYIVGINMYFSIASIATALAFLVLIFKRKNLKVFNPSNERVCIIIPAYNEEKTIHKSLESAINQDYENYYIVVIDDNSKDNTCDIALRYKEKYPDKIFVVRNESNKGKIKNLLYATKNFAADIYLIIDADNEIPKNYVSYYVSRMKDTDMLETPISAYNANINISTAIHTTELILMSFIRTINFWSSFTGRGMFIRKEVFNYIRTLNYKGIDDGALMNSVASTGKFRWFHPDGPSLKEYATENFKDLIYQRFRWYGFGIYEAISGEAHDIVVGFGLETGLLGGIAVFGIALGSWHAFIYGFLLTFAILLSVYLSKYYKTPLSTEKIVASTIFLLLFLPVLIAVSIIRVLFKKEKEWYKVSKG
ncbi:MAG: glycosyltransferase family 2 protein [Thermotogaceae bacterium]|nr:glycosyltransferase family 2 protein [Thermotogaceae bacterium]